MHVVDWTNPEAVRVMREEYGRLLATGAAVVKADFGEEAPVEAAYADGSPGARMHNLYPLRYQQAVHAATAAARGEREAIAWSRSGWAGAQRDPVHWGGDVPPAWEMMLPQLHGGLSLGLVADGREATIGYQARAGRHQVEVEGHHGEVLLDAPPGVELRR